MTRRRPTDDPAAAHPDDPQLLAYLDGELTPELAAVTKTHFDRCWTCRSRLSAMRGNIEAFLRVRQTVQPDDVGDPRTRDLRRRLEATRTSAARTPAIWRGLLTLTRPAPDAKERRRALLAPLMIRLATSLAAVAILLAWLNVSVSASRVLERAAEQERAQSAQTMRVAHSVVTFERVEDDGPPARVAALDTAADAATARRSIRVRRADGAETRQLVSTQSSVENAPLFAGAVSEGVLGYLDRQRWVPSLSIAEYQKLIAGRGTERASGRRAWGNLFEVRHPFAASHASRLTETRIWLDRTTYEPTRISLFAEEHGHLVEYRLTRTLFELVPRTPAWARVFTPTPQEALSTASPLPASTAARTLAAPPPPPPAEAPLAWSDAPATEAEVEVALALNRVRADLSEAINVFPTAGRGVLVQGMVPNEARKRELVEALGTHARVQVELYASEAERAGQTMYPAPWVLHPAPWMSASDAITVLRRGATRAPGQSWLLEAASTRPRPRITVDSASAAAADAWPDPPAPTEAGISVMPAADEDVNTRIDDVLAQSTMAFVRAWAWQRLDVQFGAPRGAGLSPAALAQVETIRHTHRVAIARAAGALRMRLTELLGSSLPTDVHDADASASARDLTSDVVVALASEQSVLVRALVDPAPASSFKPRIALARLVIVLDNLARVAEES